MFWLGNDLESGWVEGGGGLYSFYEIVITNVCSLTLKSLRHHVEPHVKDTSFNGLTVDEDYVTVPEYFSLNYTAGWKTSFSSGTIHSATSCSMGCLRTNSRIYWCWNFCWQIPQFSGAECDYICCLLICNANIVQQFSCKFTVQNQSPHQVLQYIRLVLQLERLGKN